MMESYEMVLLAVLACSAAATLSNASQAVWAMAVGVTCSSIGYGMGFRRGCGIWEPVCKDLQAQLKEFK